jgi:hypothetical protein
LNPRVEFQLASCDVASNICMLYQQEGFSVDAFFLIDSATKSVKPTLRMQYEADGLKMELFFATALKGTDISCHERTVITVGR